MTLISSSQTSAGGQQGGNALPLTTGGDWATQVDDEHKQFVNEVLQRLSPSDMSKDTVSHLKAVIFMYDMARQGLGGADVQRMLAEHDAEYVLLDNEGDEVKLPDVAMDGVVAGNAAGNVTGQGTGASSAAQIASEPEDYGPIKSSGPFVAGFMYDVVPGAGELMVANPRLQPASDNKFYYITRGKYIGICNSAYRADVAVSRVSGGYRKGENSQDVAVRLFNEAAAVGALAVRPAI